MEYAWAWPAPHPVHSHAATVAAAAVAGCAHCAPTCVAVDPTWVRRHQPPWQPPAAAAAADGSSCLRVAALVVLHGDGAAAAAAGSHDVASAAKWACREHDTAVHDAVQADAVQLLPPPIRCSASGERRERGGN